MGDEIYYRYQESLINELMTTLTTLLERLPTSIGQEIARAKESDRVLTAETGASCGAYGRQS